MADTPSTADTTTVRGLHVPLSAGDPDDSTPCAECGYLWPCDAIREADRADAEKERADKAQADLDTLLCNGPEERVWLGYKHERDAERSRADAAEADAKTLYEALRLTQEYVGNKLLPPIPGWSWYDAIVAHETRVRPKDA